MTPCSVIRYTVETPFRFFILCIIWKMIMMCVLCALYPWHIHDRVVLVVSLFCVVCFPTARKSKEITEEMLLKRSERNKRRKLLADKRKEKTKVFILWTYILT